MKKTCQTILTQVPDLEHLRPHPAPLSFLFLKYLLREFMYLCRIQVTCIYIFNIFLHKAGKKRLSIHLFLNFLVIRYIKFQRYLFCHLKNLGYIFCPVCATYRSTFRPTHQLFQATVTKWLNNQMLKRKKIKKNRATKLTKMTNRTTSSNDSKARKIGWPTGRLGNVTEDLGTCFFMVYRPSPRNWRAEQKRRPEQNRTGQDTNPQDITGQSRAEDMTGQDRSPQDMTGHSRPEQGRAEKSREEQRKDIFKTCKRTFSKKHISMSLNVNIY